MTQPPRPLAPTVLPRRVIGFVNLAHLTDHMFMLIFPTAVLAMEADFSRSYGELLALSIGGFIAFGAGSLPSGWLGDHWSRRNMLGGSEEHTSELPSLMRISYAVFFLKKKN